MSPLSGVDCQRVTGQATHLITVVTTLPTTSFTSPLAPIIIIAPSPDAHFCASPLHQIMPQDKSRQIFIGNIPYGW